MKHYTGVVMIWIVLMSLLGGCTGTVAQGNPIQSDQALADASALTLVQAHDPTQAQVTEPAHPQTHASALQASAAPAAALQASLSTSISAPAADDSWIIKWKHHVDPEFAGLSEVLSSHDELRIVVARPKADTDSDSWLEKWKHSSEVEYIQSNETVSVEAAPNDPLGDKQRYLEQIRAYRAWDTRTGNPDITIAIVDTGVDLTHPDLAPNLVKGANVLNADKSPQDDNGHGTNVAGLLAAVGNNKLGVAGVMWNAKIMPIKALEADGSGKEAKLGEGIMYAIEHNAKIIVLSLGLYRYSPYLRDIVNYAEEKGVLLVAATGNDGKDVKYPAAYPTVLAVGGVDTKNRVDSRSNFGPEVDVVAPFYVYTTANGVTYDYNEGTSMAAPQVAGVAALIWSKYPNLSPLQVRMLIRQTAEKIESVDWSPTAGYGMLRADRALTETPKADIYGNNNSSDQAKALPVSSLTSAVLDGGMDEKWFYIDAPYDGSLLLHFRENSVLGLKINHYSDLNPSGLTYSNVINKTISLPVVQGRSLISVQLNDKKIIAPQKYELLTEFQIYTDPFKPNDKQYQAYTLQPENRSIKGTFSYTDAVSYFSINFEQSGILSLKLSTDTMRIDPVLRIEKNGEKTITVDEGGEGVTEYSDEIPVTPGKYYIRVSNGVVDRLTGRTYPVTGQYTLTINYKPKFTNPNAPNDKPILATLMENKTALFSVLTSAADVNWYKFVVRNESAMELDLSQIPLDRILSMTLHDYLLKEITTLKNAYGDDEIVAKRVLPAGTYYVKVSANRSFDYQMYRIGLSLDRLVSGYKDITNHWAVNAIGKLTAKGIVSGYGDYLFKPENEITRAEAVTMIVKGFGLNATGAISYTDLSRQHWAYDAIAKATRAGIVAGNANGTFAPDRPVTRAEMATMLANALQLEGSRSADMPFSDAVSPDWDWAIPYIVQMSEAKWISGYADGTFRPRNRATRAEFAALLQKVLER